MTLKWETPAGSLGTITERIITSIPLTVTTSLPEDIRFELIAGELPRGFRLSGNAIKGSPTEVRKFTTSRFVIRAISNTDIDDRTFSISVDGSDAPEWITKEGFLHVGQGENYFVLDNTYVDFQLEAYDSDIIAGDKLTYFLLPSGGELPPGLILTSTGRIYGFTDPIFAVDVGIGGYDTSAYDITYYDKAEAKSNGFDSYLYDIETYDYSEPSQQPRRLSRAYTFIIGVTDGLNETRRLFKIWVVSDEFLKADNSIVQVDTNLFRADNTTHRVPIWITKSDLGTHRANNYLTIFLDVYDPPTLSGTIVYLLLDKNPDGSTSELPPGMTIDTVTGEIAGRIPYQSKVSLTYKFTVQAIDFPASNSTLNYSLQGDWINDVVYQINQAVRYNGFIFICIREHINQLPTDADSIYWKSTVATADKTFTIDIIGEIESAITWDTPSNLGTIKPNQASLKTISATSHLYGSSTIYELVSGKLPPGLELQGTGDIIGKVKQFSDIHGPGLTRFYDKYLNILTVSGNFSINDIITGQTSGAVGKIIEISIDSNATTVYYDNKNNISFINGENLISSSGHAIINNVDNFYNVSFDGNNTKFDKTFKFKIKASDAANFAELISEFYITVVDDNTKTFANLYLKAFQSKDKRAAWYDLITNNEIFKSSDLYRYGDPNFGIQTEIKILLYAGIESVDAVSYVQAMSRNHYRKQIRFGDLKYAVAKDPDTQEPVYEVVYVDIVDELQTGTTSISKIIELENNINSNVLISYDAISVDSDIPFASDRDHQRVFPNSLKNMRSNIKTIGERDRSFLPLWMRSIQTENFVETGYLPALVLCYLKPGFSQKTISRIKGKTTYASRGAWNATTNYTPGDTVTYTGQVYTAKTYNKAHTPTESDHWILNFNFNLINFTADRYIIDTLDNVIENKYLAFPQIGEKLP